MAMDMFIKIGSFKGESRDKTHGGEIDVLAWSWGMSNSGSAHFGGGGGAGKVNVQDLSFTKWIDKTSPDLMLATCNGKHIPEATLVVRKAGVKFDVYREDVPEAVLTVRKAGETPLEYLIITMQDVLVSAVSTGGSGGEDRLTENVTLNFARVKVNYTEQTPTGGAGDKPQMGWDIEKNVKL